jgi:hypothetical protein
MRALTHSENRPCGYAADMLRTTSKGRCLGRGRGLGSAGLRPPVPRRLGFSFAFVGRGDPLPLLLLFKAMLFSRAGKSGRPPPLEPSLKVHRDIAHNQSSGLLSPPGQGLNARGPLKVHPKWTSRGISAGDLCAGGIDRHVSARNSRTHQRASRSRGRGSRARLRWAPIKSAFDRSASDSRIRVRSNRSKCAKGRCQDQVCSSTCLY